jgi:predicted MFS family arabinose efflux permease
LLKLPPRESTNWKTKLRRIDFLGAVVLVGAVLGFLIGLDRGSNVSWKMPLTIASLGVSTVLFVVFILVETKLAVEPFAPGRIIFNRTSFACYGCNFFSFGGWIAALFYIPLYFQAVDGVSATTAGVRLLPGIIAGVSGSLFAGVYMKRSGKYYWLTVAAYTSLTTGVFCIYLFSGGVVASTVPMICGMVLSGFGNGIGVTSTLIGLSEFPLDLSSFPESFTLTFTSLKRYLRRSGGRHCLLVFVPLIGIRDRSLSRINCCSASAT